MPRPWPGFAFRIASRARQPATADHFAPVTSIPTNRSLRPLAYHQPQPADLCFLELYLAGPDCFDRGPASAPTLGPDRSITCRDGGFCPARRARPQPPLRLASPGSVCQVAQVQTAVLDPNPVLLLKLKRRRAYAVAQGPRPVGGRQSNPEREPDSCRSEQDKLAQAGRAQNRVVHHAKLERVTSQVRPGLGGRVYWPAEGQAQDGRARLDQAEDDDMGKGNASGKLGRSSQLEPRRRSRCGQLD